MVRLRRLPFALDAPGKQPADFITAFKRAPLPAWIASLSIAMDGWDLLVDPCYVAHFQEVETLVVTVDCSCWFSEWEGKWHAPEGTKKLELPRLRRIAFRYEYDSEPPCRKPEMRLVDLTVFVQNQFSGAQLPLLLSLKGVEVQGLPEEFHHVFNVLQCLPCQPRLSLSHLAFRGYTPPAFT